MNKTDKITVIKELDRVLHEYRYPKTEMGVILGVSRKTIHEWLRWEGYLPNIDTATRIKKLTNLIKVVEEKCNL